VARKVLARPNGRQQAPSAASRVRAEVAAIALVAFALLTVVALVADQGALLRWWRASLLTVLGLGAVAVPLALTVAAAAIWHEPLRGRLLWPGAGASVSYAALLGLAAALGDQGAFGQWLSGLVVGGFGPLGGIIALLALLVVGIIVAANRTLAELARPAFARRPRPTLRPGDALAGGTAPRFDRAALPTAPEPFRMNLPEERPRLRLEPAPEEAAPPRQPSAHPSAIVAVEGVLHARADRDWTLPSADLLEAGTAARSGEEELKRNKRVIEETLAHFSIAASVVEASVGPVVTRYELKPAAGVKLSRIEALADDLSLALAARSLRIEAPVPGKSVLGIEIPNLAIGLVSLRDVAETMAFRDPTKRLPVAIARDVAGSPIVLDLAELPHLLVAGQTGSGKSVCISAILCSLLLGATPDRVRLLLGDLKRVDFPAFNGLPHLIVPLMHDHERILNALHWVTGEMDRRYRLFARASARNIADYNQTRSGPDRVPYIVFVIDELADLMLRAPIQVEKQITRIAQLARATGIHLVLGTQRPSVDVITGLIKANIPARIAFATASAVDSRTILDLTGAEKLLGRGDMLVLPPNLAKPIRAQGVFVSDPEINYLTKHWKGQGGLDLRAEVAEGSDEARARAGGDGDDEIDDDRYEEAVEIVQRAGQASVSMLQRKMTIGFARAGRLIDVMEQNGVIGPPKGPGKLRDVYGAPRRRDAEDGD